MPASAAGHALTLTVPADSIVRVAAALGFGAVTRRDRVSVHTCPLDRPAPRFVGRRAIPALFAHVDSLGAGGTTDFAAATAHLLARPEPPGLTVVLSDLLAPEWEASLSRLPAGGGDVVRRTRPLGAELDPVAAGDVDLVDGETGARVAVNVSADTAARYRELVAGCLKRVEQRYHQVGAVYVRVMADERLEPVLLIAWRRNGVLR